MTVTNDTQIVAPSTDLIGKWVRPIYVSSNLHYAKEYVTQVARVIEVSVGLSYKPDAEGKNLWGQNGYVLVDALVNPNGDVLPRALVTDWAVVPDDEIPPVDKRLHDVALRVTQARADYNTLLVQYEQDVTTNIGENLMTAADNAGLCSQYDDFVDDTNDKLVGPFRLPTRETDVEIRVSRVRVVHESTIVTVTMPRNADLNDYHDDIVEAADSSYDWSEDDEDTKDYEYEVY